MKKLCKTLFAAVLCITFLTQCTEKAKKGVEIPELKNGTATFSGKIVNNSETKKTPKSIQLTVSNPITGIPKVEKIEIDSVSGSFSKEISILSSGASFMQSALFNGAIPLIDGETTEMYVDIHPNDSISASYKSSTGITFQDQKLNSEGVANCYRLSNEILNKKETHEMPLDQYKAFILDTINKKIDMEFTSKEIGQYLKGIGSKVARLNMISSFVIHYSNVGYESHLKEKKSEEYSFLKGFDLNNLDLNNAEYLKSDRYSNFIRSLIKSKELQIPNIEKTPLTAWMDSTQSTLKGIVGFDSGMFFDLLASNAYALQMEEFHPLTDAQKIEIESYFVNKTIVENLLDLDVEKIKEAEEKRIMAEKIQKISALHINETPQVEATKIVETIVAKHKGKVVFVDFWATWCGPCLWAMEQASPVKIALADKDVVYVYITNPSSPKEKWESMYPEIGGEHYYVNAEEWKAIGKQFEIKGIPHYRIFDKNGKEKHKSTGFMGAENMQKWIEGLQ